MILHSRDCHWIIDRHAKSHGFARNYENSRTPVGLVDACGMVVFTDIHTYMPLV